jgi:hypothetical protein
VIHRRWLLAAVVVAALVAACGDTADDASDVRPFSEVQANEFVFENDPMFPGRGIFRVATTEAMICAIVWGDTEALGNFNNSLDMNGTGIVEHNVFLPGAEPGGTYFYRVQGSTADGALYQSAVATFTLPTMAATTGGSEPAREIGQLLTPLASVADVSSEFSDSWSGANAMDGLLDTEWSSAGDGDDAFITLDLGEARDVAGAEFVTRAMADGSAITMSYYVVVDDGERLGPFPAGTPALSALQLIATRGRLFRFEVAESTGGNTGAIEVRLYGAAE